MIFLTTYVVILTCGIIYAYAQPLRIIQLMHAGLRRFSPRVADRVDAVLKKNKLCSSNVITAPKFTPCKPGPCSPCPPSPCISSEWSDFTSKKSALEQYEDAHNTKIIIINHKDKSGFMGLMGESLGVQDERDFLDAMRDVDPQTKITLVLNTPGGACTSAETIANAIMRHPGGVEAYVPYRCLSAGTMIALAARHIHLAPGAYCGPIDPQLCGLSAPQIINFCSQYIEDKNWLRPIMQLLYSQAMTAMDRVRELVRRIGGDKIETIELELLSGKYNHDKPLFIHNLETFLPVSEGFPPELLNIFRDATKEKRSSNNPLSMLGL